MTGERQDAPPGGHAGEIDGGDDAGARRATVRTRHDRSAVVSAAIAPDNTPEMSTRVEGDEVVTTIRRATTGGLASTVDDYVVNATVAERTAQHAERYVTRR